MKCPKCGYLGFKHVERCPNCGYDFSLSSSPALLDLAIRPSALNTPQPLADLALVDSGLAESKTDQASPAVSDVGPVRAPLAPTPELPLFGKPIVDDTPLITRPSAPRTPLAVRRATPELPRLRAEARTPMLDFASSDAEGRPSAAPTPRRIAQVSKPDIEPVREPVAAAGIAARVMSTLIDVGLLAAVDVGVVYLTMQICGVAVDEWSMLPKVPLIGFLFVQNISYFVLFTAGGQTMGQMALGIKVIADDAGQSPDLSRAVLRTVAWTILTIPAGLGLATALFADDHRALHDRFTGTRVVRAGAA